MATEAITSDAITPDTTLERAVSLRPEARGALRALGVDLCCGGALTLREASDVKGVPLSDLLRAAKGSASPADTDDAAPPRIEAHYTIRSVLARAPELAAVFERHGLGGCGGPEGPEERLDLFAKLHRVDLGALLDELNAPSKPAAGPPRLGATGCASRAAPSAAAAPPATLYRRFVVAALLATMSLGATLGAYQLMALHMAIGDANPAHARSHANFQVMGFVLLFIMGVSYHALPRFLSAELALERWARRSFWLLIAGLFVRNYALLDPLVPGAVPALAAGTVLQVAAVAAWTAVLIATWRRARPAPELFLATGTGFWALAAAVLAVGAGHSVIAGEVERAASWNEPHYLAALLGGAVLWVEGMFLRTAAFFLGLQPARPRLLKGALALGVVGPLVAIGGGVAGLVDVRAAGLFVTGAGIVCFALGARIFERRAADADPDRHLALLLRLAVGSAVLFSILSVLYAAPGLFGVTMRSLVYDGARHALTVGFITVTIFAMAGRIMPVFAGTPLRWRPLWAGGGYTIVLGVLLRETEVICGLGGPDWLLRVSGSSGYVAAAGVVAASVSILATLRGGAARTRALAGGAISADSTVAEVLASSERALEVLLSFGFDALRNPVLRATMARGVTLRQACAMKRVDADEVLAKLRAVAPAPGPRRLPIEV